MRVYIVDDSAIVADRLAAMLSGLSHEVELVGHAQDAIEAMLGIRSLKPDLVILDISMPGGSGIDVLEDVKRGRLAPKVIILTNYPYPQYRKRCMDAGADFFFDKSTEFDEIPKIIQELARRA